MKITLILHLIEVFRRRTATSTVCLEDRPPSQERREKASVSHVSIIYDRYTSSFGVLLFFSTSLFHCFKCFYRNRVRSLVVLVTHSLTHWLTHSLLFSKLDWCDPGVWRCQLKTCWCCNCCWWGSCWQQFVAEVWSSFWIWSSGKISSWSLASFFCWCFEEVMKVNLGRDSKARFGQDFEA